MTTTAKTAKRKLTAAVDFARDFSIDRLENRALLSVSVANPLANVTAAPSAAAATLPLSSVFTSDSLPGTVVRFVTTAGLNGPTSNIDIELYDTAWGGHSAAPISTANFLSYVNSGAYDNTFFHRASDFAGDNEASPAVFLQGGSYTRTDATDYGNVATNAPINLEYAADRPNVAGTIAFARTSAPNSATSGFFFNVASNSSFDVTGNQYAVFGQVIGTSQSVLNTYAALPRVNAGGAFATLPVTTTSNVSLDNTVLITSAAVIPNAQSVFTYSVQTSDASVVTPSLDGNGNLILTYGQKVSTATVTLTATDLSGASTTDTFNVTVAGPTLAATSGGQALASSGSLALGSVAQHAGSPAAADYTGITLTNTGSATLELTGITLPTGFLDIAPSVSSLAPGASTTLYVALNPSAAGTPTGDLLIATNDPASPLTVHLSGTVLTPASIVASISGTVLSPGGTIRFQNAVTASNGTPPPQHLVYLTLANPGQVALTLDSVTVPTGFLMVGSAPTSISAGGSTTLLLTVNTSVAPGNLSGPLVISSSDAASPLTLNLAATLERPWILSSTQPTLTVTDADGTKVTYTLSGPGAATIGLFSSAAPTVKGKTAALAGTGSVNSIALAGTTAKSSFTASGKGGNGTASVASLTVSSAIGSLSLPLIDVSGTLSASSLGTLSLAGLTGTATFGGALTTATFGAISSANLIATSAKTFTVKQSITASTLSFSGSVTTLSALSLVGSSVRVGVSSTSPAIPTAAADFVPTSALGTLSLTSKLAGAFSDSSIFASAITTANLGLFSATPSDSTSIVSTRIKSLTAKGPAKRAISLRSLTAASSTTAALAAAGLSASRFSVTLV
jgi:cyclophilin family peptidyl-prolyl cis-trans isomerase